MACDIGRKFHCIFQRWGNLASEKFTNWLSNTALESVEAVFQIETPYSYILYQQELTDCIFQSLIH